MQPGARPDLRRLQDGALVGGVAVGLARHLGLSPLVVRLLFAATAMTGGAGLVAYGAFWALVPQETTGIRRTRGREDLQLPAIAALVLGGLLLVRAAGYLPSDALVGPALLAAAGVAVVWLQADAAQRRRWLGGSGGGVGRGGIVRIGLGVLLLVAGASLFLAANGRLGGAVDGMIGIVIVVAGLLVTFAPLAWRLLRDLGAEQRARIRSEERAEMAAHLHDSVLQTLTAIQRPSVDPDDVQRLARRQERELRAWLYGRGDAPAGESLTVAVEHAAGEVEEAHAVSIEVVSVGDCALDRDLEALVRAAREAMVNAAKFAGVRDIAVFVEVAGHDVTVCVRDTGRGFDPTAVPDDRHGVADSIVGRMTRHGGTAAVRTAPGEGTEVELHLTRSSV